MVREERISILLGGKPGEGKVLYWMSRDQRVEDNWALIYAKERAKHLKTTLEVAFCLVPSFNGATLRQYGFMLRSLFEVQQRLKELGIKFHFLIGNPGEEISGLVKNGFSLLVTDFDPLRIKRKWKDEIAERISIPFHEVDAHNIVPCRFVSGKTEFGAYTLRPKITRLLPLFLEEFPSLKPQSDIVRNENISMGQLLSKLKIDKTVPEIQWQVPGEDAAKNVLEKFILNKLEDYSINKNDPNKDACSSLSAYLHFGQISAQRIALEIIKRVPKSVSSESFLEELIVRRELSDNYCFYNPEYDSFKGFPAWAKLSLDSKRNDKREYLYGKVEFENAVTHDLLWNAAQNEMKTSGRMHGYMRMYWAKKILEWTASPEEALEISIYLNDKYQLDGRDPNGYVGCAWSIGGVHDRAWADRPVFGKIRYMNYNGSKRKFDVSSYIQKWL